jgi:signal transduction histidine kinase/CheY-like chemotaxis protein
MFFKFFSTVVQLFAMKKIFSLTFHQWLLIVFLISMLTPFFYMTYMFKTNIEESMLRQKETYLFGFARYLDMRLGPGGYRAILEEHNALNASREEKIAVLNKALSGITDEAASALPKLGIGYYCREVDAIVTYGPSSEFANMVGRPIAPTHPGREVMRTGVPQATFGSMVRGNILNAMLPIVRDGEVVGYIWSNELTTDIMNEIAGVVRNIIVVLCAICAASIAFFTILSRRALRAVDAVIKGVQIMSKDLSYRIPHQSGEMAQMVASINDMAENVQKTSEEMRISTAVLQNVTNNVDAMIYAVDLKHRKIIYANDALRDWAGEDDLQGRTCYRVMFGLSEPCSDCLMEQLFDPDGKPLEHQIEQERHDENSNRKFLARGRIILWPDNRLVFMVVAIDITERYALAQAEAASIAQRDFLSRMSHELRTPMNGVLGMTQLALQADPPPRQQEYLNKIKSSASLLLGIINDILDFSRIEAERLELETRVFNLHAAIQNIRELILPRTQERQIALTVKLEPSVPEYVAGDELRLSQVLLNLLGNSAKFTSEGGVSLTVDASPLGQDQIRIHCEVRDTGIGMNDEEQKLLFKPFSQTNASTTRKFGGTGLGLAICKTLVELMGGAISVSSSPGKGSVFSFFVVLGAAEGKAQDATEQSDVSIVMQQRYEGYTFLLVEDNAINQEIATALLSDMGADVDVADNGLNAVKAFLNKDYDLIFMDVRMPVMDGMEATRRIRASGKHDAASVPIIAMTANVMVEDREQSAAVGMNGHLAKPIDMHALRTVIFRILKGDASE